MKYPGNEASFVSAILMAGCTGEMGIIGQKFMGLIIRA